MNLEIVLSHSFVNNVIMILKTHLIKGILDMLLKC